MGHAATSSRRFADSHAGREQARQDVLRGSLAHDLQLQSLSGVVRRRARSPQWSSSTWSPFPPLLPAASNFLLTLLEDPHSSLTLGPSCGGAAGRTLHCRAFILTLTN